MLYLAYGMNSNIEQMAYRCPAAVSLGRYDLLDHRLVFRGVADVVYSKGDMLQCVLWDITDDCLKSLDSLEGFPHFYDREMRIVEHWGEEVEALVYFMQPGHEERSPSMGYYKCLQEGYHAYGVPTKQIKRAVRRAKKSTTFRMYNQNLTNKDFGRTITV